MRHLLDANRLVRATAGGALRGQRPRWRRLELRPVELKSGQHLQVVAYDERQSFTSNYLWGADAEHAVDELLSEPFGHWNVASTDGELGFRVSKSERVLVTRSSAGHARDVSHDRVKNRLVDPAAPFLRELGVSDPSGVVKKSRADKYHQVEEFVRLLDAAVREARSAGRLRRERLRVVDLGCGNAYLTFAAYQHLTVGLGLSVEVIGVDVKDQARRHNIEVAGKLGWSTDVHFVEGAIENADVATPVDVTLALHACDTATDDALARGVRWGSELILAAPCCHHDIQRQLRTSSPPPPYGLVTRHGLLQEHWGDLLTDALRVHLLRRGGYRTDLVEFVDSQHTPRNVLLRAHLTGSPATSEQEVEYQALVLAWELRPRLEALLAEVSGARRLEAAPAPPSPARAARQLRYET
ncbi:MAG: SAM-dependent methyltransferase [Actinomycetia bacterium]|nr:SAM-dependent methyltransferase [Actinomycetes bacterium]